jgi:hypothetical protein
VFVRGGGGRGRSERNRSHGLHADPLSGVAAAAAAAASIHVTGDPHTRDRVCIGRQTVPDRAHCSHTELGAQTGDYSLSVRAETAE